MRQPKLRIVEDRVLYLVQKKIPYPAQEQVHNQVMRPTVDQIRGEVWDKVWDQLYAPTRQVQLPARKQIMEKYKLTPARSCVAERIRGPVWGRLPDQTWSQITNQVHTPVQVQVGFAGANLVQDQIYDRTTAVCLPPRKQ